MKTFIYTTTRKTSRSQSGYTVNATIYQIVKNMPIYVTSTQWNTAAFKGETSEIMNELATFGEIPAKYKEGYYKLNNQFIIIAL